MKPSYLRTCVLAFVVASAALACGSANAPSPVESERTGTTASAIEATPEDLAWVAQVMPVLLGRRVRGPGELIALANATQVAGRAYVLRRLMASDEFTERWAGFFLERFRVGREPGSNWNFPTCYDAPRGATFGNWSTAANAVRDHAPHSPLTTSTETFNMADVIRGAITIDNAFPAYRGYLFTLVQRSSTAEDDPADLNAQAERGELFSQTVLNRSPVCMSCHHTGYSATTPERSYLLPLGPVGTTGIPAFESLVFPAWTAPTAYAGAFRTARNLSSDRFPFPGWHRDCGKVAPDAIPGDTAEGPTGLIRFSGNTPTVWKVDDGLVDGWRALPPGGWPSTFDDGPEITTLWLAASFANDVWREVTGHSLTIANFLSRNRDQYSRLDELARVAKGADTAGRPTLSLRNVLGRIVSSSDFLAAVTSMGPKVFEPFLDEEPSATQDWRAARIHRHSADVLFRSAAYALGKPPPAHFPTATRFPTLSQAKAQGMSLSPERREAPSPSLEGLLNWEDTVARCTPTAGTPDWISGLVRFADARPSLRTIDVVDALKFRLMTATTVDATERAAIASVLGGAVLEDSFAARSRPSGTDPLVAGLRQLCGTFIMTPELMLGGEPGVSLAAIETMPTSLGNLTGSDLVEESEIQACMAWGLNTSRYDCDPAARAPRRNEWSHLERLCPRGRCFMLPEPEYWPPYCQGCPPWSTMFEVRPPRGIDPRDPFGGGGSPVPPIPVSGGVFLAYAPGARIVATSGPLPLWRATGQSGQAGVNTILAEGDAIDIPATTYVKIMDTENRVYETPLSGLGAAANNGTWTFMATGPVSVQPVALPPPAPGNPMTQGEVDALLQQWADAERNGEAGSSSFVHTVSAPAGNSSFFDDPAANDKPDAVIVVAPRGPSTSNPRNIGLWYDSGRKRWAVYNENGNLMPNGASFSLRAMRPSTSAVVHRATATNISGHMTYLSHQALDGKPQASFQVSHVWNPVGTPAMYNNHPVGVWYNTNTQRWAIYNEDFAAMPVNASFNLKIGGHSIVVAQSANLVNGALRIDSPETNGLPNAKLFVTHNWNPPGAGTAYHAKATGTRYDANSGRWSIFNVDGTAIPAGVGFNVHRGY